MEKIKEKNYIECETKKDDKTIEKKQIPLPDNFDKLSKDEQTEILFNLIMCDFVFQGGRFEN